MIQMPDEVKAQQQQRDQWQPLQAAYQQSVEQIMNYGDDGRVAGWLAESTRQFIARATKLQKVAEAQAVVKRLRPQSARVVTLQKGAPMTGILGIIELKKSALQTQRPDLGDTDALSEVFKREPGLYSQYRKSVDRGDYLPEIKKRDVAPTGNAATAALMLLVEAEVRKGISYPVAVEAIAKGHPALYAEHTAAFTGRG